jgi:polyhydroxyalkanoate synthesis regulator phasin
VKPNKKFQRQPKSFWACVRSLSQDLGYAKGGKLLVPTYEQMASAFLDLQLEPKVIVDASGKATVLAVQLREYFEHRAEVLTEFVEPRLMDKDRAREVFDELYREIRPKRSITMNKQTGEKAKPSYLTGIVNMLIEQNCEGLPCDLDPRKLTTVTKNGRPVRTLSRRVDGAFPRSINPIAIWEIKEYYYTTTFGSRVADGVYESLLDGLEIEELKEHEQIEVKHYLIVDAYLTWWTMGKPYLCRMIDMLHMGYVDEILFGYEVVEQLPGIVREWVSLYKQGAAEDHGLARSAEAINSLNPFNRR